MFTVFMRHIARTTSGSDEAFELIANCQRAIWETIANTVELVKQQQGISIAIEQVNSFKVDAQCK